MKLNLFLCCVAVLASTMISSAQGNNNPSFTRGFAGNVEAGVLFKDGFAGEYVNVSSGYNILPGLFAGVGIGIKNYCCPLKVSEQRDIHPQCSCNGIADDFSEGKPLS